ncbi:hypothetical protein C8Q74DRAFT_1222038 [Fomes fomentarius]|nr:hypothetical protein C8Q74DRAFT_1222038 [Fomes fomentarius]
MNFKFYSTTELLSICFAVLIAILAVHALPQPVSPGPDDCPPPNPVSLRGRSTKHLTFTPGQGVVDEFMHLQTLKDHLRRTVGCRDAHDFGRHSGTAALLSSVHSVYKFRLLTSEIWDVTLSPPSRTSASPLQIWVGYIDSAGISSSIGLARHLRGWRCFSCIGHPRPPTTKQQCIELRAETQSQNSARSVLRRISGLVVHVEILLLNPRGGGGEPTSVNRETRSSSNPI